MPREISPERQAKIIALAQAGMSKADIQRQTGVSTPVIRRILADAEIETKPYRTPQEVRDLVVDLYTQKRLGTTTIERETGIPRSTALKILQEAGVLRRPLPTAPGTLKGLPLPLIADRHLNRGEPLVELAAEYGVSYAGLRERLERDDLIPRRRRQTINVLEFVQAWQEADSVDEAAMRLGLSKEAAIGRAGHYRRQGVPLKRFSHTIDWQEAAEFAALFDRGSQADDDL